MSVTWELVLVGWVTSCAMSVVVLAYIHRGGK